MPSKVATVPKKNKPRSKKKEKSEPLESITNSVASSNVDPPDQTGANSLNQSVSGKEQHHRHHSESNRKITDYFHIRKSTRKCKSDLEKERRMQIEESIKLMCEEGLEVRHVDNKGRGVFAKQNFERGDFVCEYAGEMVSYKVAKKREETYANDPSVGCYMYFFEYKSKNYCIDATAETSRLGRLLNHSKLGGNCHTKIFEMNSKPHLIFFASRQINTGEELTYDYGDRNKVSLIYHPWLKE